MSWVILDGFESENAIGGTLKRLLEERDKTYSYFKLKDMNVLPCRSCGSCGVRTPGKCVIDDDMHGIMRAIARSSVLVMHTPLRFGGYSSQLKKAVDKLMPLGMPFYIVKDGHMLHPMRYGKKTLIGIGLAKESLQGQEENFRTLVARNALNMQSAHKTIIFKPSDDITKIKHELSNIFGEVSQP